MKIKEMNEIVNMLDKEWDLGKKSSYKHFVFGL